MHSEALCLLIKMSQIKDFDYCLRSLTVLSTAMLPILFGDQSFNIEPDRPMTIVSLIPENRYTNTHAHTHTVTPKRASNLRGSQARLCISSPCALKCSFSYSYHSETPKLSSKSQMYDCCCVRNFLTARLMVWSMMEFLTLQIK